MPLTDIYGERWLMLGKPKTGKSTFAASFPDVLAINGDGAGNKYVYPKNRRLDVYDYKDFLAAIEEAKGRNDWRTLVLDPIDRMVSFVDNFICTGTKFATIADIAHGAGWAKQTSLFNRALDSFWMCAESKPGSIGSIVIAHSKKNEDGQSLTIRQALHSYLQGGVNNIAYCLKRNIGGKLMFAADLSGGESVEAGCRNPVLQGAGTIDSSWDAVAKLFEPSPESIVKAFNWLLSKGGITKEQFDHYAASNGIVGAAEAYEFIKRMRNSPAILSAVKKSIEHTS